LCAHIGRETGKIPKGTIGEIRDYLAKHPDGAELVLKCPHCKEIFDSLMKSNVTEAVAKDATLALVKTMVKQDEQPGDKKEGLPIEDQPKANVLEEVMMKVLSLLTDVHKQIVMQKEAPEAQPEVKPEEKPAEVPAKEPVGELPVEEENKMEKSEEVKKLEQPVAPTPTSAPATEQPLPPPPAPPMPPKEVVETPKPAPVPQGGQENVLSELLKDPQKLRKISYRELDKLIGRTK
jgi:hypothetical protein